MKRVILISLTMLLVLFLCACNAETTQKENNNIKNDTKIDTNNDTKTAANTEGTTNDTSYNKVSAYMKEECKKVFSPYYELLDFQISDYKEEVVNGNIEAVFYYKLIYKNYDKDPDTVGYIKEAKESGNKNYQKMYDEYLLPKEMNFELKAIIDENDSITLYSNTSPKGIKWEEVKMSDFIISK